MTKPKAKTAETTAEKKPAKTVARREPGRAVAVHNPQMPAAPKTMLEVIMAAVADPRCDTTKMQALLDMQKQIEERDAQKAFTRDFIKLQRVLPVINRDGKIEIRAKDNKGERTGNVQQASPYATYPNIMRVCKPLLDDHGFTLASWIEPEPGGARIVVVSQLDHVEHHSRRSMFPLPAETSGSKNNVQGWGSSQQYGMRYNAIALLNIVTMALADQDTDGHGGTFKPSKGGGLAEIVEDAKLISKDQRDEIVKLLEDARVSEMNFCLKYGIKQVIELPAALFEAAKKALVDYKALKAKQENTRG